MTSNMCHFIMGVFCVSESSGNFDIFGVIIWLIVCDQLGEEQLKTLLERVSERTTKTTTVKVNKTRTSFLFVLQQPSAICGHIFCVSVSVEHEDSFQRHLLAWKHIVWHVGHQHRCLRQMLNKVAVAFHYSWKLIICVQMVSWECEWL